MARVRTVFLEHPRAALSWLGANLRPLPRPTDFDIDLWLTRLAHPRFAVREEATRQLIRHFDVAGPAVREMLATTRSPEVGRMGTAEARELLFRIARGGGVPAGRAADALVRIREREKGRPVHEAKAVIARGHPDNSPAAADGR